MGDNEPVLFESQDKSISLNVPLRNDNVWLNRNQMAELFDRDVKTIGKHVNNTIREELKATAISTSPSAVRKCTRRLGRAEPLFLASAKM